MNSQPLDNATVVIPPADGNGNAGAVKVNMAGVMCFISSATSNFRMQFDADTPFPAQAGFKFIDSSKQFNSITFFNDLTVAVVLNIYVGAKGVDYVGPYTFKPVATQPLGNLGITSHNAVAQVFGQKVNTIAAITNHGAAYQVGDVLFPPDGAGVAANFVVQKVGSTGNITKLGILLAGNYSINPATPCNLLGGTGHGAIITLTFAGLTGAVLDFAAGWLTITQAVWLIIPNGVANNARKQIGFKVKTGSAAGLLVMDANGNVLRDLVAGEERVWESSGVFTILPDANATCTFTVDELYYA